MWRLQTWSEDYNNKSAPVSDYVESDTDSNHDEQKHPNRENNKQKKPPPNKTLREL